MSLIRVLITVKSYPTLSSHYDEQLSIAGITEDGNFIRIYPIPFSLKAYEEQVQLYDWIEIDLLRNTRDFRLESFYPQVFDAPFKKSGHLGTENYWSERKAIVLKRIYRNLSTLLLEARHEAFYTSLAVFKPRQILGFDIEETEREWDKEKLEKLLAAQSQVPGFEQSKKPFEKLKKLPYKFSYRFTDDKNQEISLPIEDWQLASLFWKLMKKYKNNETKVISEIRKKYQQEYVRNTDLHFYLGTTQQVHASSKQPFTIAGLFLPEVPPAVIQGSLF